MSTYFPESFQLGAAEGTLVDVCKSQISKSPKDNINQRVLCIAVHIVDVAVVFTTTLK